MAISTPFTQLLGLTHPIVLAPMAGVAGGRLAAAVSEAGGLGLVGGGYGDERWLREQLKVVATSTDRPWGAGLITWSFRAGLLEMMLDARPAAVLLAFGDPAPYAAPIKDAGARLICQVQSVRHARHAAEVGADVIVAQGTEAGGHGAVRSTLPLVPAIVDAVSPVPVLAAGGIADGRGLAAALALGAAGVLVGTRFCASTEALGDPKIKQAIVQATGDSTCRTRVFDAARGYDWPDPYTGRAVRNAFVERWQGKETELRGDPTAQQAFWSAVHDADLETAMVWAGEDADLVTSVEPAGDLVRRMSAQAEQALDAAGSQLRR